MVFPGNGDPIEDVIFGSTENTFTRENFFEIFADIILSVVMTKIEIYHRGNIVLITVCDGSVLSGFRSKIKSAMA